MSTGFKAGRDRPTLLFGTNAVGFMIRAALSVRLLSPKPLKREEKHQPPDFWLYNKKAWTGTLFLDKFHRCFVPVVRKYLASKEQPFKVLLILDDGPAHPQPQRRQSGAPTPDAVSLIQPPDQGVIRTSASDYTRYSMQHYGREP